MQRWNITQLVGIVVLVLIATAVAYKPILNNLNLGLDLRGGLHVVLQAVDTPDAPVTADSVQAALGIVRNRIDQLGVKEPVVQTEGNDRIVVELAGVQDPQEAVRIIGKTAILEFRGPGGQTELYGSELQDAQAAISPSDGKPEVHIKFKPKGTQVFADMTTRYNQQQIAVYLDNQVLMAPVVREPITTGEAVISGSYNTLQEAESDAILLRSGSLPVKLEIVEKRTVGPMLGSDSLQKSLQAGYLGLAFIFLFMLGFYRFPGLVANFTLILYGLLVMGVLALLHATITLPGIAGILLSVGMAVDANIIIFERMKEELRSGKTLMAGIDAGFSRAFWTIFDANLTTLIGAGVLLYFGTGPIKGFAVTLSIGILASMFTAITFTRYLLRLIARSRVVTDRKWYGV